ncbi:hypothetical protein V6615_00125 [Oscillospiraceae bacterium PP1C4]
MNWLRRIMAGRYGTDQLSFAMLACCLLLMVLDRITGWRIFWVAEFAMLVLGNLRIFSRNISRRYQENQKFMQLWRPVQARLISTVDILKDSKTHRHFKCPSCGQKLRVPKGKGKISITCTSCRSQFVKKT